MLTLKWGGAGPERRLLFELKTLLYGATTYLPRDEERCRAVLRRAEALPAEYAKKAHKADRTFCATLAGEVGPVEAQLRTFDPVKGLVFGAWGEASPDVHRLLDVAAAVGAARHARGMLVRDPALAKGALAWLLKRRWGLAAVRHAARLTLGRLEHVGSGASAAPGVQRAVGPAAPS